MVLEDDVKKLAFSIWEQEGHPQGKDVEHYYRARQILEQQESKSISELKSQPPAKLFPSQRPEQLPKPSTRKRTRVQNKNR